MQILTVTQEIDLAVETTDIRGNPAPVEFDRWASSDETVLVIVPRADGQPGVTARCTGTAGNAQVSFRADPHIDGQDDDEPIVAVEDFEVRGLEAVTARIVAGAPREQVA